MSYDYGYGYDYSSGYGFDLGGLLSGILVFILIAMVIGLVFAILSIIGQWKCFKKAGYKGWESLIPGHNQFVNCAFAGVNPILVLGLTFGSVVTFIPVLGWLAYIGFFIYYIFAVGINTAKVFGKGIGFGIALAIPLSAPIAWFILGKEDIKYVGVKKDDSSSQNTVKPTQEVVHNELKNTTVVPPVVEQPTPVQPSNCSRCGAPINVGDKFCMHCGNQL